jgi:hypothetical protein
MLPVLNLVTNLVRFLYEASDEEPNDQLEREFKQGFQYHFEHTVSSSSV